MDPERLERAYRTARTALLAERTPEGHWVGELSTSALSTATAVSALALVQKRAASPLLPPARLMLLTRRASEGGPSLARRVSVTLAAQPSIIAGGVAWLAAHQNDDGGWGDTIKSISNISTSMLCRAAFHLTGTTQQHADSLQRVEGYLQDKCGKSAAEQAEAIRARYGKDRTFAVPILTTCALADLVDWKEVQSLPFELACFPQSWFRFLRLHVVSYALPALIAIGQAIHHHRPSRNPLTRLIRRLSIGRSLRVLEAIQPSSGGFLEAAPLTSFVTLSLAACDLAQHPVARKAVEFLVRSVRPDGSWPIDSNLATWVTTLAVNALAAADDLDALESKEAVLSWLLKQQHLERHPYTGASPGGWAWTDLPGGVPDADDTPGAMLALQALGESPPIQLHVASAQAWLFGLQNGDGGMPTFCRGWGKLPFDRSGCDLTAHALRAMGNNLRKQAGRKPTFRTPQVDPPWVVTFTEESLRFLREQQRSDGSWLPLWFGNQHAPNDENPTYGTARVLAAYRDLDMMNTRPALRGIAWLLAVQNPDGGWGGAANVLSSMEETALAVEVLLDAGTQAEGAVNRGLHWLVHQVETGGLYQPTPIGFYFAKLWYFEKLYPIIFSVAALGRARRKLASRDPAPTE